jgi:hypothetical protein
MNDADPMPKDFGAKYVFWIICRWFWLNPLTIVMTAQGILFQLALDNPAIHWLGTGASIFGVIVAQIRNRGKDYTVPLAKPQTVQPQEGSK